jgi:multimeric flavodoxin WrbA
MGDENLKINIFHPQNSFINKCLGCERCFFEGRCFQDKKDDMGVIKKEMLSSDIIIFASPIYFVNVSGDMKIFLDRISNLAHLLPLRGKAGICILSSCGNGVHHTLDYMNTVMSFLGLYVIDKYNVSHYTEEQLDKNPDYMKDKISESATKIIECLKKSSSRSNETLEIIYKNLKNYIENSKELNKNEYKYWKNNNMLDFKTYEQLISKKTNKNLWNLK